MMMVEHERHAAIEGWLRDGEGLCIIENMLE